MTQSNPSKNAVTHGFYATDVVLAWEDPKEFSKLHEALRDEYWPDGFSEEAAIFDMACWYWKKRRLNVGSQLVFHRQQEASAITAASSNGWQGVPEWGPLGFRLSVDVATRIQNINIQLAPPCSHTSNPANLVDEFESSYFMDGENVAMVTGGVVNAAASGQ